MNDPRIAASRAMILDEDRWPNWPILPLKRGIDNKTNVGCLVARTDGKPLRVVLENMFGNLSAAVAEDQYCEYATVDDLLADGWVVD